MDYSVNNLTTAADCQFLLDKAGRERSDLEYKKDGDLRLVSRFSETSQQLNAELQSILAQLSAAEITISNLPEGTTKEEEKDKRTRLEYRKFVIESRMENYGTIALLEKQMDLGRVLREIDEVDAFIEAVEQKMAQIQ